MDNLNLNFLFQQIKDDFELADNQINNTIDEVIANGIDINDTKAFVEIVYDACSRIATYEINANSNMRFNYRFPYKEVVQQAINCYQKEHSTKK